MKLTILFYNLKVIFVQCFTEKKKLFYYCKIKINDLYSA